MGAAVSVNVRNIYLIFSPPSGPDATLPSVVTSRATLAAVICEDDIVVADALVDILNGLFDFDVVAIVDSGDDAVAAAASTRPDVVVVDLALGGGSGLRIVPALLQAAPDCAVVVLVPYQFGQLRTDARDAGAMELMELTDLRPLLRCLEQIHLEAHPESCPSCPARPPAAHRSRRRAGTVRRRHGRQ